MPKPPQDLAAAERARHELVSLLSGRNAHMTLADAVAGFPIEHINSRPPNVPYTFWHLVEHVRIAQADILDFVINPAYELPDWPTDYWPAADATTDQEGWLNSLAAFTKDMSRLVAIVEDPSVDIFAELDHAPGYTIYREVMVAADHNAYHTGELAILRQVMDLWPQERSGAP
jgi:hypothetical protein